MHVNNPRFGEKKGQRHPQTLQQFSLKQQRSEEATAAGARLMCRVSGHVWRWLTTAQCSVDSDTELLVRANEPWSATVISLCVSVGKSGSVLALRPSLEAHFCLLMCYVRRCTCCSSQVSVCGCVGVPAHKTSRLLHLGLGDAGELGGTEQWT